MPRCAAIALRLLLATSALTSFGAAPGAKKAKPSSSTHKLHKTRSGIFHGHKPAPQPPRKPRAGQRPKAGTGPAHRPPKHASAEPAGKPASPFKPAAEFEEAVKKASGPRPPVKPAPPAADVPDPREKVGSDSERIEVIGELVADEAFGVEGLTFD